MAKTPWSFGHSECIRVNMHTKFVSKLEAYKYVLILQILGAVVDGIIPLNDNSSPVLKDALAILSSKVSTVFIRL